MTPADLLPLLRDRGVHLAERDGRLVVRPASDLSDDEIALLRERAADFVALLREPPEPPKDELTVELRTTLDEVLAEQEERATARAQAEFGRSVTHYWSIDQQAHVALPWLSTRDIRRLEARGSIGPDQVREWARTRR